MFKKFWRNLQRIFDKFKKDSIKIKIKENQKIYKISRKFKTFKKLYFIFKEIFAFNNVLR